METKQGQKILKNNEKQKRKWTTLFEFWNSTLLWLLSRQTNIQRHEINSLQYLKRSFNIGTLPKGSNTSKVRDIEDQRECKSKKKHENFTKNDRILEWSVFYISDTL